MINKSISNLENAIAELDKRHYTSTLNSAKIQGMLETLLVIKRGSN
jgi:hypothetical protein